MTDVAKEGRLHLLAKLSTTHLKAQPSLVNLLTNDKDNQEDEYQSDKQIPYPGGDIDTVEGRVYIAINIVDNALLLHLSQLYVNGIDELFVVTDVAILTCREGDVFSFKIGQFIFI